MIRRQSQRQTFALADIIYPMSLQNFAGFCEGGRPFYIKGRPSKYAGLFDLASFKAAAKHAASITVSYATAGRGSMTPSQPISSSRIDKHYSKGATICVRGLEQTAPGFRAVVANCRSTLGFAGWIDCRAYLSADKAGYTPHFDDKTVLTLQIEGTKKWLVAPHPAVQYPLDNAGRHPDGVYRYFRENPNVDLWERFDQPQFEKTATAYTLRPGDLLLVPAGVWHAARADGHSLSIAVTFNHVGTGSAHEIILSAIRNVLIADSRWRRPPPMVPITSDDQNASSLDNLDRFFAARLDDLQTEIGRMQRNRAEIVKIWSGRVSN
jgi:hypothetical protein